MANGEIDLNEKSDLLGRSFILEALDPATRRALSSLGKTRHLKAGETIFNAGAPGDSMMAVAQGTVRICLLTPAGREVVLADIESGDVFGEIAMLDGGERSADARALTNCTLVVLERRAFLPVLKRDPMLAIGLIETLCARVRRSDERMVELAFLDLPSRLAKAVLRASEHASGDSARAASKLSLSQSELANMIGSSRENVNRCLRKWQGSNLIDLRDGWLVILDRDGLSALAG